MAGRLFNQWGGRGGKKHQGGEGGAFSYSKGKFGKRKYYAGFRGPGRRSLGRLVKKRTVQEKLRVSVKGSVKWFRRSRGMVIRKNWNGFSRFQLPIRKKVRDRQGEVSGEEKKRWEWV